MVWQGVYRTEEANRAAQAREWSLVAWEALEQAGWRLEDPAFLAGVVKSLEEQIAWFLKSREV